MYSKEKVRAACVVCGAELWRMRTILKNQKSGPFCSNKCVGKQTGKPMATRFASSWSSEDGGCWVWRKRVNRDGYGFILNEKRRQVGAHRASWLLHRGPIPNGMHVLHRCDRPSCVNPDHLFLGTQRDNILDMYGKGRGGKRGCPGDRHYNRKLSSDLVRLIWRDHRLGRRPSEIAAEIGVSQTTIGDVIKGRTWRSVEAA